MSIILLVVIANAGKMSRNVLRTDNQLDTYLHGIMDEMRPVLEHAMESCTVTPTNIDAGERKVHVQVDVTCDQTEQVNQLTDILRYHLGFFDSTTSEYSGVLGSRFNMGSFTVTGMQRLGQLIATEFPWIELKYYEEQAKIVIGFSQAYGGFDSPKSTPLFFKILVNGVPIIDLDKPKSNGLVVLPIEMTFARIFVGVHAKYQLDETTTFKGSYNIMYEHVNNAKSMTNPNNEVEIDDHRTSYVKTTAYSGDYPYTERLYF